MKLDASGNIVWSKVFGGTRDELVNSIITTPDGGYLFIADSESTDGDLSNSSGGNVGWVVKLNASGNKVWDKVISKVGNGSFESIVLSTDGSFATGGYTSQNEGILTGNHGSTDGFIVKLKPQ